jgi:predicted transcriptional regulator
MTEATDKLRELVAEVAAAYLSNAHVGVAEIPSVVAQIASSLSLVGESAPVEAPAAAEPAPSSARLTPSQIRKSITEDALISFEDGRPYKTLKRHLSVRGMTPAQYREKWGLARDYPMVSPGYSAKRSTLAKSLGLGQKGLPTTPKAVRTPRKNAKAPAA